MLHKPFLLTQKFKEWRGFSVGKTITSEMSLFEMKFIGGIKDNLQIGNLIYKRCNCMNLWTKSNLMQPFVLREKNQCLNLFCIKKCSFYFLSECNTCNKADVKVLRLSHKSQTGKKPEGKVKDEEPVRVNMYWRHFVTHFSRVYFQL